MNSIYQHIKIQVNEDLYLKDPESSVLGQQIIEKSIKLINKMGFEAFTFKKLAHEIDSTEASVYRYFENKHKLLIYIISWFWGWMEYLLVFITANVKEPEVKLKKAIALLCDPTGYLDETDIKPREVYKIIINEATKSYLTKDVDDDNKKGYFLVLKRFCKRIALIVQEINPDYGYPHSLISTIIEAAQKQPFYSAHLPSLTEINFKDKTAEAFFTDLVFKTIK